VSRPLRVLTWHVHGNYLWALAHIGHQIVLPVRDGPEGRPPGYIGRTPSFPWPDNVVEVPADRVADTDVDVVLYQTRRNWEVDRHEILSPAQLAGPSAYVEHDPPRESPTDTRHWVDDPRTLVIHVTHFNRLMWDCGDVPTTVVEHGVPEPPPGVRWTGEIERGLVVVNGLDTRGRRVGADIVQRLRREVPLDIVGMGSASPVVGGLGEVPPPELAAFAARYRAFVHPIRYTSLGLAVCEALMLGMPVVGLATTELATVIDHGRTGLITADVDALPGLLRLLLDDRDHAARLGGAARAMARARFSLARFRADWDRVLRNLVLQPAAQAAS
jgi:glycosyltransferase involved in cell wall biosynthesis